jgi:hypothetical protein
MSFLEEKRGMKDICYILKFHAAMVNAHTAPLLQ